ncbi:hypothetical protein ACNF2L_05475 [Klebsiella pneumoniae]|uniref:hypothetical protein n=1 Tax=Klebsiella pneumoniae TaxID=573 RepID=UPI0010BACA59|nr:putative cytoplasmic protein [Klebsiella pneumoniae]
MNPYLQEVLDAHVLIERWLSHGEGSAEALMFCLRLNNRAIIHRLHTTLEKS